VLAVLSNESNNWSDLFNKKLQELPNLTIVGGGTDESSENSIDEIEEPVLSDLHALEAKLCVESN
jgi:hypothetical protein